MEYNQHKRLKSLFIKNQSVAGFDPDEIYTAVEYITSHISKLFYAARKHKEQYGSIVNLLKKLMHYENLDAYEKDISQGVKKGYSAKKQHRADATIEFFLNLYQLYTKDYGFYKVQFNIVFLAKNQGQHVAYMDAVSAIYKKHVDELEEEIEEEKKLMQTQTSSKFMLFNKNNEEDKETDPTQQFLQTTSSNSVSKGNI